MKSMRIYYPLNSKLSVTAYEGHFATRHSHNSHYIDITEIKHQHMSAREAAIELAQRYVMLKNVDTIVCLDGSEVLGAFLARHLAKKELLALNSDKNINVITPEYDSNGQLIFRENRAPMVQGKDVVILISTVNSGKTVRRILECVEYYGGHVQGVVSVFSNVEQVDEVPVYALFTAKDIPNYMTSAPESCPLCAAGQRIEALANSYGMSKL